jgi:uncharacterized membrane protein
MDTSWLTPAPGVLSAFLGSLVEFVEALTVVLAVGAVRGWRAALIGTWAAAGVLLLLILILGPVFLALPIGPMRLVIGLLALLFGLRWLRKAMLRAAGVKALHDENAAYAKTAAKLAGPNLAGDELGVTAGTLDRLAMATAFKAVLLEGVEVVFIVLAVGRTGASLSAASLAALAAGALVIALGLIVHRPLARVPENSLKFCVGVLLSAFGVFWVGEGLGLVWPGDDLALPALALGMAAAALLGVAAARWRLAASAPRGASA